jgi:hypothetical protein
MPLSQEDAENISKHTGLVISQFTKPLTETSFVLELANDPKPVPAYFWKLIQLPKIPLELAKYILIALLAVVHTP